MVADSAANRVGAAAAASAVTRVPAAAAVPDCSLRLRFDRRRLAGRCAVGGLLGGGLKSCEAATRAAEEVTTGAATAAAALPACSSREGLDGRFDASLLLGLLRLLLLLLLQFGDLYLLLFLYISFDRRAIGKTKVCPSVAPLHGWTPRYTANHPRLQSRNKSTCLFHFTV